MRAHEVIRSAFVDAFVHVLPAHEREQYIAMLRRAVAPTMVAAEEEDRRLAAEAATAAIQALEKRKESRRRELYALDDDYDGLVARELSGRDVVGTGQHVRVVDVMADGPVPAVPQEREPRDHRELRRRFYALDSRGLGSVRTADLLNSLTTPVLATFDDDRISHHTLEQHLRAHTRSQKATRALIAAASALRDSVEDAQPDTGLYFRDEMRRSAARVEERRHASHNDQVGDAETLADQFSASPRCESSVDLPLPPLATFVDLGRLGSVQGNPRRVEVRIVVLLDAAPPTPTPVYAMLRPTTSPQAAFETNLIMTTAEADVSAALQSTPVLAFEADAAPSSEAHLLRVTIFDTVFGEPLCSAAVNLSRAAQSALAHSSRPFEARCPLTPMHPDVAGELHLRWGVR